MSKAYDLAKQAYDADPTSLDGAVLVVQNLPLAGDNEDLRGLINEDLWDHSRVKFARAFRHHNRGEYDEAIELARELMKDEHQDALSYFCFALPVSIREDMEKVSGKGAWVIQRPDSLLEALEAITKACELAPGTKRAPQLSHYMILKGDIAALLNKTDIELEAYETAKRLVPENKEVQSKLALAYYSLDLLSETIAFLAPLMQGEVASIEVALYSESLRRIGDKKSLEALSRVGAQLANGELEIIDKAYQSRLYEDVAENLLKAGLLGEARDVLESEIGHGTLPLRRHTLLARSYLEENKNDLALAAAKDANAAIRAEESFEAIAVLGEVFFDLGEYEEALALMLRRTRFDVPDRFTEIAIRSAQETQKPKVLRDITGQLIEAGVENEQIVLIASSIAALGSSEAALELILAYQAKNPESVKNHRRLNLQRSALATECKRPDDVILDLDLLPAIGREEHPQYGLRVVKVLTKNGALDDAHRYAYELWRAHPDDPHANMAIIGAFLPIFGEQREFKRPDSVTAETTVVYQLEHERGTRYYVLEASENRSNRFNEIDPESEFVKTELLGKRVGATFVPPSAFASVKKTATVREIWDNALFRSVECKQHYESRFPEHPFISSIYMGEDGEGNVDLSALLNMMKTREEETARVEEKYLTEPLPISFVAKQNTHGSIFAATSIIAHNVRLPIRVVALQADAEGREQAHNAMKRCTHLVLDATSVSLLWSCGLLDTLRYFPWEIVIPESVMDDVETCRPSRNATLRLGLQLGQLATSSTEEFGSVMDSVIDSLRPFVANEGAGAVLDTIIATQNKVETYLGRSGHRAAAFAMEAGYCLWSDDGVSAYIAREEMGLESRTWTQEVLRFIRDLGVIADEQYSDASILLLAAGCQPCEIRLEDAVRAGELSKWDVEDYRLAGIVRLFENPNGDQAGRMIFAARLFAEAELKCTLVERLRDLVWRVLDTLTLHEDGRAMFTGLTYAMSEVPRFKLNPIGYKRVSKIVADWAENMDKKTIIA